MTEWPRNPALAKALEDTAASLDIPPHKYQIAVERYTAVGNWLDAGGTNLKLFSPTVSVQGSFRLGTVVPPVVRAEGAGYDIDLVCRLDAAPFGITPRELKHYVGDRLKESTTYRRMLDQEGRRCWTLNYAEADGVGFHLDVLPAILGAGTTALEAQRRGVPSELTTHAIEATERQTKDQYIWLAGGTNPEGYARWFDQLNRAAKSRVLLLQRQLIHDAHPDVFADVQSVPEALVRTPLQRSVQLLKRHRDVRFAGHPLECEKPISIIITTLAALAYRGEPDAAAAVLNILDRIEHFTVSGVMQRVGDRWVIPNPVNPAENFADRWNQPGSRRAEAFFQWVSWAREDLSRASAHAGQDDVSAELSGVFGLLDTGHARSVDRTLSIAVDDAVPDVDSSSHCQQPPWPLRLQYMVRVTGSVRPQRYSAKHLWSLTDRAVQKDLGIRFEARTNAPLPYDVKWQVVNTGTEARKAGNGQLRGGFDDGEGTGGVTRWEGTAYRGTHWIEAFVIKNGLCIARSGRTYVRVR
jgi:hypothetical protein